VFVSLPLLFAVGVLLAMWTFLRRRRLAAAAGALDGWGESTPLGAIALPDARRPALTQFGLNPLGQLLLGLNVFTLSAGVLLLSGGRVSIEWSTAWPAAALLSALVVVWLNLYFLPGSPKERFVAEVLFVTFAMLLLTNVLVPMQYGALALGAPYTDSWLARADAALGISVPAMTGWARAHPAAAIAVNAIYFTFAPQMLLTVLVLAALRDRDRLWEFAFHFHVCLIVTIAALGIWPAICPPAFYGYQPTVDMTRAISQIRGFHDGVMTSVRFDDLDGLVSFPSFHVAGALLVTWAFRGRRRILLPLLALNAGLIMSTMLTGEHYAIDVVGAVPLVAASLAAYRWGGRRLLTPDA
jgi:hypothetical protein